MPSVLKTFGTMLSVMFPPSVKENCSEETYTECVLILPCTECFCFCTRYTYTFW
jgi:hypothetical protein